MQEASPCLPTHVNMHAYTLTCTKSKDFGRYFHGDSVLNSALHCNLGRDGKLHIKSDFLHDCPVRSGWRSANKFCLLSPEMLLSPKTLPSPYFGRLAS